jgi:hypothetical protein
MLFIASTWFNLASGYSIPNVHVTVNGGIQSFAVNLGTTVEVSGTADAADSDLQEHWLEVLNPAGVWSWEGWLTTEPWAGALIGNNSSSKKTGSFTPKTPGIYAFRTTAISTHINEWAISNWIQVEVRAVNDPDTIFQPDGVTINPAAYSTYLDKRDVSTLSTRLGPTFEALNPGAPDDRPTHPSHPKRIPPPNFWGRINPYELGLSTGPGDDNDYWSESGQALIAPDDPTHCGVSRMQVFAYYNRVFAISPRFDVSGGDRDFFGDYIVYKNALGKAPTGAVASVRNYSLLQNEALIITKDGLLGAGLTQTSREGEAWPMPYIVLPPNKKPTAIAVTSSNELALITVWDTQALKGQLAVVALQGKWLGSHTMHRTCQPNEGSWSAFKLLGYVDLPMAAPSSVAAASNSAWGGPSQTANLDLGQIDLSLWWNRDGLREGESQWTQVFASKGYAVVASKLENKMCLVDLSAFLGFVRASYLVHDDASYAAVIAKEAAGQFPYTFDERPETKPVVVWQKTVAKPTCVLAAPRLDRWSTDYYKAYVASEDGNIHIIDASSLMARYSWHQNNPIAETGSFYVGKNPTSMCFTRFTESAGRVPLMPVNGNGSVQSADPLNNTFYVACRGDRKVVAVCSYGGRGKIYREIIDSRMSDPVAVSVAGRGNIVTIADYTGKCLHSFRLGSLGRTTPSFSENFPVNNPGFEFDYAGQLNLSGSPFAVNSANVN